MAPTPFYLATPAPVATPEKTRVLHVQGKCTQLLFSNTKTWYHNLPQRDEDKTNPTTIQTVIILSSTLHVAIQLHRPDRPTLAAHSPARSVNNNAHEAAGNDASHGQGNEPAHVDPEHHAPVDGAPRAGAETNTNRGARDALSGGNGELCRVLLASIDQKRPCQNLLRRVARMTVTAEPNSMENPREGECSVMRLPKFFMML